jgi:PRTRC genetic system ThiF family protein
LTIFCEVEMAKKHKFKGKQNQRPIHRPAKPEVLPALDLGFLNAATIVTPPWQTVEIIIVGCGGSGGYLAQHAGRIMYTLYMSSKMGHIRLVDPELVEEPNLGRQLFCVADVGQPKAAVLARRYSEAWGLNTSYHVGDFSKELRMNDADLTVIVGCVDGARGRRAISQALSENDPEQAPRIWWLDLGNAHDTGQVLFGCAHDVYQMRGAFLNKEACYRLPSPAIQHPELLAERPDELQESNLSCAEMAAANLQSLNVNARVAAEASDFLTRFLVTQDLRRFACQVNTAAGSVTSTYATPEEVARASRKPVSYVIATQTDKGSFISADEHMPEAATMGV